MCRVHAEKRSMAASGQNCREQIPCTYVPGNFGVTEMFCVLRLAVAAWCVHVLRFTDYIRLLGPRTTEMKEKSALKMAGAGHPIVALGGSEPDLI